MPPLVDSPSRIPAQQFRFQDGGSAIYFAFDKSLGRGVSFDSAAHVETYVFVVSGSDCASMQYFLPEYFRGLEGESGPLRLYVLQKRFITARTWGRVWGCGADFIKADHPSRWIADQTEFINAQLSLAAQHSMLPKRVVVAGISEGGDIVPILAQRIPSVTHAVIVANGGMDPLDAYRLQARRHGFDVQLAELSALDRAPPADPDAPAHYIAGRSWRYWSELRQLTHSQNLLALSIPISIAMGDADQSVPIESALHIQELFDKYKKNNLNLIIYPGADHALQGKLREFLPDFWHAFDLSLQK